MRFKTRKVLGWILIAVSILYLVASVICYLMKNTNLNIRNIAIMFIIPLVMIAIGLLSIFVVGKKSNLVARGDVERLGTEASKVVQENAGRSHTSPTVEERPRSDTVPFDRSTTPPFNPSSGSGQTAVTHVSGKHVTDLSFGKVVGDVDSRRLKMDRRVGEIQDLSRSGLSISFFIKRRVQFGSSESRDLCLKHVESFYKSILSYRDVLEKSMDGILSGIKCANQSVRKLYYSTEKVTLQDINHIISHLSNTISDAINKLKQLEGLYKSIVESEQAIRKLIPKGQSTDQQFDEEFRKSFDSINAQSNEFVLELQECISDIDDLIDSVCGKNEIEVHTRVKVENKLLVELKKLFDNVTDVSKFVNVQDVGEVVSPPTGYGSVYQDSSTTVVKQRLSSTPTVGSQQNPSRSNLETYTVPSTSTQKDSGEGSSTKDVKKSLSSKLSAHELRKIDNIFNNVKQKLETYKITSEANSLASSLSDRVKFFESLLSDTSDNAKEKSNVKIFTEFYQAAQSHFNSHEVCINNIVGFLSSVGSTIKRIYGGTVDTKDISMLNEKLISLQDSFILLNTSYRKMQQCQNAVFVNVSSIKKSQKVRFQDFESICIALNDGFNKEVQEYIVALDEGINCIVAKFSASDIPTTYLNDCIGRVKECLPQYFSEQKENQSPAIDSQQARSVSSTSTPKAAGRSNLGTYAVPSASAQSTSDRGYSPTGLTQPIASRLTADQLREIDDSIYDVQRKFEESDVESTLKDIVDQFSKRANSIASAVDRVNNVPLEEGTYDPTCYTKWYALLVKNYPPKYKKYMDFLINCLVKIKDASLQVCKEGVVEKRIYDLDYELKKLEDVFDWLYKNDSTIQHLQECIFNLIFDDSVMLEARNIFKDLEETIKDIESEHDTLFNKKFIPAVLSYIDNINVIMRFASNKFGNGPTDEASRYVNHCINRLKKCLPESFEQKKLMVYLEENDSAKRQGEVLKKVPNSIRSLSILVSDSRLEALQSQISNSGILSGSHISLNFSKIFNSLLGHFGTTLNSMECCEFSEEENTAILIKQFCEVIRNCDSTYQGFIDTICNSMGILRSSKLKEIKVEEVKEQINSVMIKLKEGLFRLNVAFKRIRELHGKIFTGIPESQKDIIEKFRYNILQLENLHDILLQKHFIRLVGNLIYGVELNIKELGEQDYELKKCVGEYINELQEISLPSFSGETFRIISQQTPSELDTSIIRQDIGGSSPAPTPEVSGGSSPEHIPEDASGSNPSPKPSVLDTSIMGQDIGGSSPTPMPEASGRSSPEHIPEDASGSNPSPKPLCTFHTDDLVAIDTMVSSIKQEVKDSDIKDLIPNFVSSFNSHAKSVSSTLNNIVSPAQDESGRNKAIEEKKEIEAIADVFKDLNKLAVCYKKDHKDYIEHLVDFLINLRNTSTLVYEGNNIQQNIGILSRDLESLESKFQDLDKMAASIYECKTKSVINVPSSKRVIVEKFRHNISRIEDAHDVLLECEFIGEVQKYIDSIAEIMKCAFYKFGEEISESMEEINKCINRVKKCLPKSFKSRRPAEIVSEEIPESDSVPIQTLRIENASKLMLKSVIRKTRAFYDADEDQKLLGKLYSSRVELSVILGLFPQRFKASSEIIDDLINLQHILDPRLRDDFVAKLEALKEARVRYLDGIEKFKTKFLKKIVDNEEHIKACYQNGTRPEKIYTKLDLIIDESCNNSFRSLLEMQEEIKVIEKEIEHTLNNEILSACFSGKFSEYLLENITVTRILSDTVESSKVYVDCLNNYICSMNGKHERCDISKMEFGCLLKLMLKEVDTTSVGLVDRIQARKHPMDAKNLSTILHDVSCTATDSKYRCMFDLKASEHSLKEHLQNILIIHNASLNRLNSFEQNFKEVLGEGIKFAERRDLFYKRLSKYLVDEKYDRIKELISELNAVDYRVLFSGRDNLYVKRFENYYNQMLDSLHVSYYDEFEHKSIDELMLIANDTTRELLLDRIIDDEKFFRRDVQDIHNNYCILRNEINLELEKLLKEDCEQEIIMEIEEFMLYDETGSCALMKFAELQKSFNSTFHDLVFFHKQYISTLTKIKGLQDEKLKITVMQERDSQDRKM